MSVRIGNRPPTLRRGIRRHNRYSCLTLPPIPELKEMFPDAPYIARPGQINAWDNEGYVKAIKATGRKQVIIAGMVPDACAAFRPCRHWLKGSMCSW